MLPAVRSTASRPQLGSRAPRLQPELLISRVGLERQLHLGKPGHLSQPEPAGGSLSPFSLPSLPRSCDVQFSMGVVTPGSFPSARDNVPVFPAIEPLPQPGIFLPLLLSLLPPQKRFRVRAVISSHWFDFPITLLCISDPGRALSLPLR